MTGELQIVHQIQQAFSGPVGSAFAIFAGRYLIFVFAFLVAAIGFGKDRKQLRQTAYEATWAALISMVIATSLGMLIDSPRPFIADPSIQRLIPVPLTEHSMPSGHTATAFGAAAALMYGNPIVGGVALVIAGLIGLGRIASGVHYPSDVIAGAILGIVVAISVHQFRSRKLKRWMEMADESDDTQ